MIQNNYYVYISTNRGRTVLYIGVTNNVEKRIAEHLQNKGNKRTFAGKLIYYEHFFDIKQAIQREKELKNLSRKKKENVIKQKNPGFNFLII
ncbi:MAG: GIY-YIG nuclease family protein [Calditrichaeota bacterium]|nr:GIY-YIG nuclease family protein [Calditrichota bacterium]